MWATSTAPYDPRSGRPTSSSGIPSAPTTSPMQRMDEPTQAPAAPASSSTRMGLLKSREAVSSSAIIQTLPCDTAGCPTASQMPRDPSGPVPQVLEEPNPGICVPAAAQDAPNHPASANMTPSSAGSSDANVSVADEKPSSVEFIVPVTTVPLKPPVATAPKARSTTPSAFKSPSEQMALPNRATSSPPDASDPARVAMRRMDLATASNLSMKTVPSLRSGAETARPYMPSWCTFPRYSRADPNRPVWPGASPGAMNSLRCACTYAGRDPV